MFRKKIAALERSLKGAGLDMSSKITKCLWMGLVRHGYLDSKMTIVKESDYSFGVFGQYYGQTCRLAAVKRSLSGDKSWRIVVWGTDNEVNGKWYKYYVTSEYDLFGNLTENV